MTAADFNQFEGRTCDAALASRDQAFSVPHPENFGAGDHRWRREPTSSGTRFATDWAVRALKATGLSARTTRYRDVPDYT